MSPLILATAGIIAGFIDSIAGGGGLITLPLLTLVVGPGPPAIGTNKIVGFIAAIIALGVYARRGHMDWRKSIRFTIAVGIGAYLGSLTAPLLPLKIFWWFLLLSCPLILWVVWNKNLWVARQHSEHAVVNPRTVLLIGLLCGFYDGVWGPGGGTFMFLGLLFGAHLPLFAALAAAKFANTCSAGVALLSYQAHGYVHWEKGIYLGAGIGLGAFLGANFANRKAELAVRPVLVIVVTLLLIRLATG